MSNVTSSGSRSRWIARALACVAITTASIGPAARAEAGCRASAPARCLRAGEQDPTFGSFGYAIFHDLGNGLSRGAMDLALLPDGRIVMGGSSTTNGGVDHDPTLARFSANGQLDPTFGAGGVVRTILGPGNAIIQSIAVQSDGKILAAGGYDSNPLRIPGYTTGYVPDTSFLVRFEVDGALDTSFGDGGLVVVSTPGSSRRYERVLLQPGDGILTVGFQAGQTAGTSHYFVERRDGTGALDPAFGSGGIARAYDGHFRWTTYYRAGAALQADGKIVIGGAAFAVGPYLNCALARFDANGALDPGFGGGQILLPQEPGEVCNIQSIAQQPDGKLLAAGAFYGDNAKMTFTLMRFAADGSPDTKFGRRGRVQTRVVKSPTTVTSHAVTVQSDGTIIEVGSTGGGEFDVVRHRPNGRPDGRFRSRPGRPGVVRTGRQGGYTAVFDGAQAVALLPDGRILVGGNPGHIGTFALARYLATTCHYEPVGHTLACE